MQLLDPGFELLAAANAELVQFLSERLQSVEEEHRLVLFLSCLAVVWSSFIHH